MLSPAFLCVLHEGFSAVLVTIIGRTGSPGALSEGDKRRSICLQKPSLGTRNPARSPQVTYNFNCVNKPLAPSSQRTRWSRAILWNTCLSPGRTIPEKYWREFPGKDQGLYINITFATSCIPVKSQ